MATKCVSATSLVQTNLKCAQNVSMYYLSFQNDQANPKCKFVTHSLPKRLKKAFQDKNDNQVQQTQSNLKCIQNVCTYHLNVQNDQIMLKCKFITHNLQKFQKV